MVFSDMAINGIVMKLVGPICPTGDRRADEDRLENLKLLTRVIVRLLGEVDHVARYADRPAASEQVIGEHALRFLAVALKDFVVPNS